MFVLTIALRATYTVLQKYLSLEFFTFCCITTSEGVFFAKLEGGRKSLHSFPYKNLKSVSCFEFCLLQYS